MQKNLMQLYKRALDEREIWLNRWKAAMRYTIPTDDADSATLFDATAAFFVNTTRIFVDKFSARK